MRRTWSSSTRLTGATSRTTSAAASSTGSSSRAERPSYPRAMPTKKQRRRQQKSRRHDYEYVYVDDEGNEVAVEPTELRAEKDTKKTEARSRNGTGARAGGQPRAGQRAINPPSWRRAVRRAAIFGPVIVVGM